MIFFSISQMAIGYHVKFCLLGVSGVLRLVTMPHFVEISLSIVEILIFRFFKMVEIVKFY